jgi:hypothetical protein
MKISLFYLLMCMILSIGCTRSREDVRTVNVRIKNGTGVLLEGATIGGADYGNVGGGATTGYITAMQTIYGGYCQFKINGQELFAGVFVCGTPMPAGLAPGNYTFVVGPPITGYFTVTVIKD